jgi:hypothetical protein
MKTQVAVLCDNATQYQNRLCILGTFDIIEAYKFPVTKSQCSVALQFLWAKSEEGFHNIKVKFKNEDGQQTMEDVASIVNVIVPNGTYFSATNHIVHLQQLTFQKPGTYLITGHIDENCMAEIQLQIVLVEEKG